MSKKRQRICNCQSSFQFVSITDVKKCCEKKGVPQYCVAICKGTCLDDSWDAYKLIPSDNACHKYETVAKECCNRKDGEDKNMPIHLLIKNGFGCNISGQKMLLLV